MKRIKRILHSRRGESLIEILCAGLVFMLILGVLGTAIKFANNMLIKSDEIRDNAVVLRDQVRHNIGAGGGTEKTYSFCLASEDGTQQGTTPLFEVKVRQITVQVQGKDGKQVKFHLFNSVSDGEAKG